MERQPGTYVLILRADREAAVQVGRWGSIRVEPGYYLYVGSALGPGGVQARVERHFRRDKALRWHIDYLTSRGRVTGLALWPADRDLECRIAGILTRSLDGITGFGCSDCRCGTHLFRGDLGSAVAALRGDLAPTFIWQRRDDRFGVRPLSSG